MGLLRKLECLVIYAIGLFWACFVFLQCVRLAIFKPTKFFASKNRKVRPACLDDPRYGVHGFARVKDVRLHYVASGPSNKPLMVLLHGFPEFWYSWRHQIVEFNKEYRVVAVDLRGYSESDRPDEVSKYTVDELVEDIRHLIPALGYESCVVVGHDWGGAITWGLASKYPELIEKAIILNCPHPKGMGRYMATHWRQFMKSWYMFFVNLPYFPEWYFYSGDKKMLENCFRSKMMGAKPEAFTDEDIEAFKYTFNNPSNFTGGMNYIRAALRYGGGKDGGPGKTDIPILLIWGTRDGALSKPMAELSQKYAPKLKIQYIEGASHWVQQDEPALVNKYIWAYLGY